MLRFRFPGCLQISLEALCAHNLGRTINGCKGACGAQGWHQGRSSARFVQGVAMTSLMARLSKPAAIGCSANDVTLDYVNTGSARATSITFERAAISETNRRTR
jgi:hypothetical protein